MAFFGKTCYYLAHKHHFKPKSCEKSQSIEKTIDKWLLNSFARSYHQSADESDLEKRFSTAKWWLSCESANVGAKGVIAYSPFTEQ